MKNEDRRMKQERLSSVLIAPASSLSVLHSLFFIFFSLLSSLCPLCLCGSTAFAAPPVTAVAFTPDGRSVVVGSQAGLEVRTWPELERVRTLATELAHVHDLAFAPDGKSLAAAGGAPAQSGVVELFRWPDGGLLHRMK